MKTFRISTGKSRLSPTIERKEVSWQKLSKRLLKYDTVDVKYADFLKLDREKQSSLKDVGYFIGGQFKNNKRVLHEMEFRSLISLDIDHIDSWDLDAIRTTYEGIEHVVHSTLKHCEDTPRLRLVFPLAYNIPTEQYEPVARGIAARIGMDLFDDTTFQPARIMFWPAVCVDGEVFKYHNEGHFLDPEAVLDKYDDWQDFNEWPHSSRVKAIRPSTKKAEDPLTKKGVIGAFNRTYDIHTAIERFDLPYEATDNDNRYRPTDATGPSGAVVYDDVFLYSHHESDAVGQRNVNAWDLVRIHRFGDADASKDLTGVPIMEHPSSKQMAAMVAEDPEVQRELRTPKHEMDVLPEHGASTLAAAGDDQTRTDATGRAPHTELTFDTLTAEISGIDELSDNLHAQLKTYINRIAAAKLDPQDVSVLAGLLREKYAKPQPTKSSIEKAITITGKRLTGQISTEGELKDMERLLIEAVLDDHFQGGEALKRVGRKCWTYEQGLWEMRDDESVRAKLHQTYTRLREERPEDMMSLVATVAEGKTSQLVKSVYPMMCDMLAGKEKRDDPLQLMRSFPLPVINCKNCELHFDADGTLHVRKHNPQHFYTIRVDTAYDSNAKCPEWDRFMQMVFSNTSDAKDMVRHFEEFCGYALQMSRWLKTWAMFHGPTDTGKSTAAMVLQTMLGKAFAGKSMDRFAKTTNEFAEAGIIGKLLMVDDDYAYGAELPDGFLKKYSEEKPTSAGIKYGDDINFRARAMPLILSNHWPGTRDTTSAFINRALVIPFTYTIKGADKDDQRRDTMMNELPGILNRFVAGISRLRKRGTWDKPLDCIEVEQAWARKSNPFLQFVNDCLLTGGLQYRIERGKAFQLYEKWYDNQQGGAGRRGNPMHRNTFYNRMREHFGDEVKSSLMYFIGVKPRNDLKFGADELVDMGSGNLGEVGADADEWDDWLD